MESRRYRYCRDGFTFCMKSFLPTDLSAFSLKMFCKSNRWGLLPLARYRHLRPHCF